MKIDTLPNYCNGKLYKRWDSVRSLYGDGSIIASKQDKNNETVQLFITEKGNKKELFHHNEKDMEIIDSNGTKRFYNYRRINDNTIKGQMTTSLDINNQAPLVIAAKWITKNIIPEKLFLKINPNHPRAEIYIPDKDIDGNAIYTGKINKFQVVEILAKDFENENNPLPKTILLKNAKGLVKPIIAENSEENLPIIKHFGLQSNELGENLRTIV